MNRSYLAAARSVDVKLQTSPLWSPVCGRCEHGLHNCRHISDKQTPKYTSGGKSKPAFSRFVAVDSYRPRPEAISRRRPVPIPIWMIPAVSDSVSSGGFH